MLAQGIDENAGDHQSAAGGNHGLGRHADEHEQGADPKEPLRGEHIQRSQNEYKGKPRQLPEELRYALVEAGHGYDFGQVIVDDAFVQPEGKGKGGQGQKKCPIA